MDIGGGAAARIITKGLGFAACDGLITTHFSLYCREPTIPPRPPGGGGGGPYPGEAWNKFDRAEDIFKPVDKDVFDPNKIYKDKKEVVIRVEFGDYHNEKTYLIPIQRAKVLIKAINIINHTRERISINVGKMKKVLHNIKISITNLRRKK